MKFEPSSIWGQVCLFKTGSSASDQCHGHCFWDCYFCSFLLSLLLDRAGTRKASVVLEMSELDPLDACLGERLRLPLMPVGP